MLPDGTEEECDFSMGQTIQMLKAHVETEYGIPMSVTQLSLEGKILIDPLSLNDFQEIDPSQILVLDVQVPSEYTMEKAQTVPESKESKESGSVKKK